MITRIWLAIGLVSLISLGTMATRAPAQTAAAPKPAATVNGTAITMAELDAVLKQAGPTPMPLTEAQRKQMQQEALNMLIDEQLMQQFLRAHGPKVTPAEVDQKVKDLQEGLKKQNKTLADFLKETGQTGAQLRSGIVTMLQWEGYAKARLTDADIKRYYDENKDFFDRVAVRASHIVLRVPPAAAEAERQATRQKLLALRQQIISEKLDFAEAATKHSQCTSAPGGGDIGYFPRKFAVDEAFAKAAFALQVGEISDVVQSEYGMHLIKVTERKPAQPSDFAKIKDEVRELCMEEMRLNVLARQRKTAEIKVCLP